jgi:hypothetical protein
MGHSSAPKAEPYVPPKKVNDPEIEAQLQKEKILARKRKGRQATILSEGIEPVNNNNQKTLLGS